MCEALRRLMKDEIAEAKAEGIEDAMLSAIANLMDTMKWTAEEAMEAIKVPLADRGRYSSQLL